LELGAWDWADGLGRRTGQTDWTDGQNPQATDTHSRSLARHSLARCANTTRRTLARTNRGRSSSYSVAITADLPLIGNWRPRLRPVLTALHGIVSLFALLALRLELRGISGFAHSTTGSPDSQRNSPTLIATGHSTSVSLVPIGVNVLLRYVVCFPSSASCMPSLPVATDLDLGSDLVPFPHPITAFLRSLPRPHHKHLYSTSLHR
jgi:hypothetical protein